MTDALDRAVLAAMQEAAERAILPRFTPGQAVAADFKAVGEAVTAADRESEDILSGRLAELIPGAAIVGEEAVHHAPERLAALSQGTCWIIDPLDGTGNFAEGKGPFGILVALAQAGKPVAGWIFDPISGRLCTAHAGKGARIDGVSFSTPPPSEGRLLVAVTKLFASASQRDATIEVVGRTCDVVDSPRCAADQYPRVATGGNDATLFTRTIAWDHAAGVVFLNEAGGRAARQDGTAYACDRPDDGLIVATCHRRWEQVVQMLNEGSITLAGAHLSV